MKNKPRIKAIIVALFSLFLSSCQPQAKDVNIFFYDVTDTFIIALKNQITDTFSKSKVSYNILDGKRSQLIQNEQIVEEMDKGSKVIIANPVDRMASPTIMEKARQTKTPVVFFNREPLSSDMKDGISQYADIYYVGTSPEHEGLSQAKIAADLFGDPAHLNPLYDKNGDGKIQVVLFKGELDHQDTELRSKNCIEGLKERGYQIDLIETRYANWQRKKAQAEMETIYKEHGNEIELVFSNNDDMALGIIDEMVKEKVFSESFIRQPFPVIGVDGTEVGLSALKAGLLYATIRNDGKKQADAICQLSLRLLRHQKIDESFGYPISENNCIYIQGEPLLSSDLAESNKRLITQNQG